MRIDWPEIVLLYGTFVISTTFHEASHALVAKLGGDPTAYRGGQVTLNPVPHMKREPYGMILFPLLMLLWQGGILGWASAPIDPYWAQRHPKRAALVSLAGPLANFALVAVAFVVLKVLRSSGVDIHEGSWKAVAMIASAFLYLNVVLGILNLLPIPPLDGAGVLEGFFPRTVANLFDLLRAQPMLMLGLVIALMMLGPKLWVPVHAAILRWL